MLFWAQFPYPFEDSWHVRIGTSSDSNSSDEVFFCFHNVFIHQLLHVSFFFFFPFCLTASGLPLVYPLPLVFPISSHPFHLFNPLPSFPCYIFYFIHIRFPRSASPSSSFMCLQWKKFRHVRSGDLGSQATGPPRPTNRFPKVALR